METIHKFPISPGVNRLRMPEDATVISVGTQGAQMFLWAKVYTDNDPCDRIIKVVATGQDLDEMPEGLGGGEDFVGSCHLEGLGLVFHVFDTCDEETVDEDEDEDEQETQS